MPWFYYVGRLIARMALLLTRCQVKGKENVPSRGPLLVVANHLNLADPPIIAVSLGRKTIFMAKEELFQSRLSRYFIGNGGAFPVRRGQLDRKALRQAKKVLDEGLALVMFPEGRRSNNTRLQPALPGSALIALRNNTPILPIGITGTEKIKGPTWLFRRPRLTVNIGHPFRLPKVEGKLSKTELTRLTDFMMGRIEELLPAEYRGNSIEAGQSNDTEG